MIFCVHTYLTPAFVVCITNTEEGLVKLVMYNDLPGLKAGIWRRGTFPAKMQESEQAIDCKHGP